MLTKGLLLLETAVLLHLTELAAVIVETVFVLEITIVEVLSRGDLVHS
jgi:hypothetical protein